MLPPIARVGAPFMNASSGNASASVRSLTADDEVQRGIAAHALAQRGLLRNVPESGAGAQPVSAQRSRGGIGAGLGDAGFGLRHPCTFEVYTWELMGVPRGDLDLLVYGVRAVNNGRSATWGSYLGAPGGAPGLLTTFVDAAGALALGEFDGGAFSWSPKAGPRTGYGGASFEAYNPNVCVDPGSGFVHLAWLERTTVGMPLEVVVVLESEVSAAGAVPGLMAWRTQVAGVALVLPVAFDSEPEAGLKYLTFDRGAGVSHFGCTFYDYGLPEAVTDNLAVFLDGPTWSKERSAAADRSSDPSVATSPDGSTVMTAWEERVLDADLRPTTSLWVKVVKSGVTYGPWQMTYGGVVLQGGDVSLWLSATWMYVAFQGKEGGIFVYRAAHDLAAVGLAPVWEPLGELMSPGVPPATPQAGYIDVGWLANLVGTSVLGVDHLAVVWELSSRELIYNPAKVVALAFLRSDGAGFAVEGSVVTMELSGEVYGTDFRFQMSPAVAMGDPSTLWLLGYLPVDVMWMEVTSSGRLPGDLYDFSVVLTHRRYAWGGTCITSF